MKKLLFVFWVVGLLAAGCSSSQHSSTKIKNPGAQNTSVVASSTFSIPDTNIKSDPAKTSTATPLTISKTNLALKIQPSIIVSTPSLGEKIAPSYPYFSVKWHDPDPCFTSTSDPCPYSWYTIDLLNQQDYDQIISGQKNLEDYIRPMLNARPGSAEGEYGTDYNSLAEKYPNPSYNNYVLVVGGDDHTKYGFSQAFHMPRITIAFSPATHSLFRDVGSSQTISWVGFNPNSPVTIYLIPTTNCANNNYTKCGHVIAKNLMGKSSFKWLTSLTDNNGKQIPKGEYFIRVIDPVKSYFGDSEFGITLGSGASGESLAYERDYRRLVNIRQFASALEIYFSANNRYPEKLSDLAPTFMDIVPTKQIPADGACTDEENNYTYTPTTTDYYASSTSNNTGKMGAGYSLKFCFGENTSNFPAGVNYLTPKGIFPLIP